ncbi:hypothetical protein GGR57DRAFT_515250 [Xylariaceae sp. FL1272]|nr:hypothetical protein GGR57DRAFT_515250 [Xylariaceae sp. FL1272]
MGNNTSVQTVSFSHSWKHPSQVHSETHRPFTVTPFEHSTFLSVTKPSAQTSQPLKSTRTAQYCKWDVDSDFSICTSWEVTTSSPSRPIEQTPTSTYTLDIDTFTDSWITDEPVPTPTGGYETSDASYTFGQAQFTCTDFLCIGSVASEYGYSLCLPTATDELPTMTWSWPEASSTSHHWQACTSCCDFELEDWCYPARTSRTSAYDSTDVWPTLWPPGTPGPWATETSDCDSTPASTSCDDWDVECWPTGGFTMPETPTPFPTKHSYLYTSSASIRRSRSSSSEDCNIPCACERLWADGCIPPATVDPITWTFEPVPWSEPSPTSTTKVHQPSTLSTQARLDRESVSTSHGI